MLLLDYESKQKQTGLSRGRWLKKESRFLGKAGLDSPWSVGSFGMRDSTKLGTCAKTRRRKSYWITASLVCRVGQASCSLCIMIPSTIISESESTQMIDRSRSTLSHSRLPISEFVKLKIKDETSPLGYFHLSRYICASINYRYELSLAIDKSKAGLSRSIRQHSSPSFFISLGDSRSLVLIPSRSFARVNLGLITLKSSLWRESCSCPH